MKLKMKGHSGCKVELVVVDGLPVVRKSTTSAAYFDRLKSQAEKQRFFLNDNGFDPICVPKIYSFEMKDRICWYDMEYFNSNDYLSFFKTAEKERIDSVCSWILDFIDRNVERSRFQAVDAKIFRTKLDEIAKGVTSNPVLLNFDKDLLTEIGRFFGRLETPMMIPVGFCHGDLTYSNILFNRHSIVLIDFLDCFIESPLQDMVKIRQDTKYCWSMQLYDGCFDRVKLEIAMQYVDNLLTTHFLKYQFYKEYYVIFQLMNFLRILPYVQNQSLIEYLQNIIVSLYEEIKI